ncbi:unnamed protein product [Sphagnum balticum]|jgi:hypothetical protein
MGWLPAAAVTCGFSLVVVFLLEPLLSTNEFLLWVGQDARIPRVDESNSYRRADRRNPGEPALEVSPPARNRSSGSVDLEKLKNTRIGLPMQNDLSRNLMEQNMLPPQNQSLYPRLKDDHVKLVLYVHNRPEYLRVVVVGLSGVEGIEETLLIVSHDGFFEEINSICAGHTILPGSCSCSISKMLGLHS